MSNGQLKDKSKLYTYFTSQKVLYLFGLNGKLSVTPEK
jgi:hypothetical protein